MDYKYYLVIIAAVFIGLIFIKKLWKLLVLFGLALVAYWYFFIR